MKHHRDNIANRSATTAVGCHSVDDFSVLYQSHYELLIHYANSILGSNFYGSDIVQDVFLKFWNLNIEKVEIKDAKNFLMTMTRNLCLDRLRNLKIDKRALNDLAQKKSFARITDDILEDLEYQRLFQEAINRLSPQRKKVFILIRIEGMKRERAANTLGISQETAKEAMRQALKTIRKYICAETGIKNREWKKAKVKKAENIWLKQMERKVA